MKDNFAGSELTLNLAHGVPYLLKSPLKSGVVPTQAQVIGCDTQSFPSLTLNTSATVNGVLTTAPAGYVFLTALYPLAEQFLYISQGPQSVVGSTLTPLVLGSAVKQVGTNITTDGASTITVHATGRYLIIGQVEWSVSAANGRFLLTIRQNGSNDYGRQDIGAVGGLSANVTQNASSIISLTKGDTITLQVFQTAFNPLSTVLTLAQVSQLSNDSSLQANVQVWFPE